jgi:hypothetical protein
VNLVFDICTGIGVAAAVGIRPFLPGLVVGALAAGSIQIHFAHTDLSFLQGVPFLLIMAVGAALLVVGELRLGRERLEQGPVAVAVAAAAVAVGGLMFAGSLCRGGYAIWPGIVGGVICAAVGILATRPLVARVRARLDAEAASALPLFAETVAIAAAALSVLLPPVGIAVLALLLWLLIAGRGRDDQKYAGLRILR